jgi:hypothetical protein
MRNLRICKNLITRHAVRWGAVLALALGIIAAPMLASAQEANSSGNVPVRMVVTVKPHHGDNAPAMAAHDVQVYQRGKQETVTGFVPFQGDRAGLQLFILIDETSRDSIALHFRAISDFIQEQPATTAIGIGYMRNGMVSVARDLTTDHAQAMKALRLPLGSTVGYTSPYLALSDLMKKWPVTEDRREIVMITSGIDPLGGGFSSNPFVNPYLDDAVDRAQKGGFIVYAIYAPGSGLAGRGLLPTNLAQTGLDVYSQATGGQAYNLYLGNPVDLTPYLQDINYNLNHQYELTFLAQAKSKPGLEPVKVKTEMPNAALITAGHGYVGTGM